MAYRLRHALTLFSKAPYHNPHHHHHYRTRSHPSGDGKCVLCDTHLPLLVAPQTNVASVTVTATATDMSGDGKCVVCDSYVRPCTLVRICDECNYGSFEGRCTICGGPGISDAYYCRECTQQEKDRDGCPKIVNLGSSKTDLFYERKKYGFKKR
ncbi:unnamed protein product [Ectocarpus sp. 6 AP-2014]